MTTEIKVDIDDVLELSTDMLEGIEADGCGGASCGSGGGSGGNGGACDGGSGGCNGGSCSGGSGGGSGKIIA